MNTYVFALKRENVKQGKIIRSADLRAAKNQIADEIDAGWTIISLSENGKPVVSW